VQQLNIDKNMQRYSDKATTEKELVGITLM